MPFRMPFIPTVSSLRVVIAAYYRGEGLIPLLGDCFVVDHRNGHVVGAFSEAGGRAMRDQLNSYASTTAFVCYRVDGSVIDVRPEADMQMCPSCGCFEPYALFNKTDGMCGECSDSEHAEAY